jgi:hypothetical protein
MKKQHKQYERFSDNIRTEIICKCNEYWAFSGKFLILNHPNKILTHTPFVLKVFENNYQFAKQAYAYARSFGDDVAVVEQPYIHFYDLDFLVLFKLKMAGRSQCS